MHLQLRSKVPDAVVKTRLGTHAKPTDYDLLVTGNANVFAPDGKQLLVLRKGGLPMETMDAAFPFMYLLRKYETRNRGEYAGEDREIPKWDQRHTIQASATRRRVVKADGTISNTSHAAPVRSAIIGFVDRYPRMPFCRMTAFSTDHPDEWGACLPFIQAIANLFKETLPDRYAKQLAVAHKTHPAYVIPETPFTTVTVNNTVAGAYHYDKGDFKDGFGVMVVFRKGIYRGSELVFPSHRVAVDMEHGDVIFFDSHAMHGNVPFHDIVGKEGEDWIRISMVLYFRTKMTECLSPPEELARAKKLRGGIAVDHVE